MAPSELFKRNPKLYSLKKAKLNETGELFEIKDLDLKPTKSLKNLGEQL